MNSGKTQSGALGRLGLLPKAKRAVSLVGVVAAATLSLSVAIAPASAATSQAPSSGSSYTAQSPSRLLDTRTNPGLPITGAGGAESRNLTVAGGSTGVPSNAAAVVLNVTTTNTSAPGYLAVFPAGTGTQPLVSNLNWAAGQTIANLVAVPVGSNGQVTLFSSTHTDVVADLQGFFGGSSNASGGYVALRPNRITDTRAASGLANAGQTLGAGSTLSVQVAGAGGVPSGATAAILNVTVTNTSGSSYLTAYPAGATQPLASNLNWTAGRTIANRVIVPLGSGGRVSLFNAAGSADVVVDVSGYYSSTSGSGYMPLSPVRIADTRTSASTLGAGGTLTVQVAGVGGTANNAKAAILNVTATNTTAAGYLTVYPGGNLPLASDLNFGAGQTIPNLVVATLSSTGTVSIFNPSGSTDVVVDLFGFFAPSAGVAVTADPTSLPADGASTSAITATATNSSGGPIFSDPINLTMSGSPSGACGSLNSTSGLTDANGQFKATYTSSQVVGSCTITATEANKGLSGSTSITQTLAPFGVALFPGQRTIRANGVSSTPVQASVRDVAGNPVANDAVSFSMSGQPAAACGTLTPSSATTDSNGHAQVIYIASKTAGFCNVVATEAMTGSSSQSVADGTSFGFNVIDQTTNPPQVNNLQSAPPNASVDADGTSTLTLTATVSSAGAISNDEVMFVSPRGRVPACGTVSPIFGATNASGQLETTYTSSTTAGPCFVNVFEANGGSVTSSQIDQSQVANTVDVSAAPSTIPADSASTSAVTATVTDVTGAAVQGDTVTFSVNPPFGFGCGSLNPVTATTDASGKAQSTYTAGFFAGFCTVSASDDMSSPGSSAGTGIAVSGSTLITQTQPKPTITASAKPSSIPADNATHSTLTITVSTANGGGVAFDQIHLTESASPAGACGNLPTFGFTNASGEFVADYKSTFTPGTCTITATEANAGMSATTTITQKLVPNTVNLSLSSSSLPADGTSIASIGAHVTNVTGAVVANDKVTFSLAASPAGACGTLSAVSATTDGSGNAAVTYTASTTTGFCQIGASEAKTGGSATPALLDQTTNPAESNLVQVFAGGGSIPANGKATTMATIRVIDSVHFRPIQGDPVMITLIGGACGTVSPAFGFTDATGSLSTTYTASTTAGPCDLVATEANGGASNNAMISQSQVANTVKVAANPSSIKGDGASTSTVTATITDVTGAPVAGDNVAWSVSAPPGAAAGACGSLTNLGSAMTDGNGHASATYTAGTAIGFCTITAEDLGPSAGSDVSFGPGGVTGSTQIDQTGPTFSAVRK